MRRMRFGQKYITFVVQTQRGNVAIEHVHLGDIVYDFETGQRYEVKDIIEAESDDIYEVTYNDGRVDHYKFHEPIYLGQTITTLDTLYREENYLSSDKSSITVSPINDVINRKIEYDPDLVKDPLVPDPYMTGALLIHGNYELDYINLPLDRAGANPYFSHKYQVVFGRILGPNTVGFQYIGSPGDSLITWDEFFPHYSIFCKKNGSEYFPLEYQRASINQRWQLIRGVFDVGYEKYFFPNTCAIANPHDSRLKDVQKILWGLGVLSTVKYDPDMPIARGRNYRLDVTSNQEPYASFFYHVEIIEEMFKRMDTSTGKTLPRIYPKTIQHVGRGYLKSLVLNEPYRVYLTDNFLPRVSL